MKTILILTAICLAAVTSPAQSDGNFIGLRITHDAPIKPPPPTPAQIAAAQESARITALRDRQRALENETNAVRWLQTQVTNGSPSAQYSLGLHYLNGRGCATNRDQAIYWITQAANQGDADASNKLVTLK
jgi:TPR repeat protein